MYPKISVSSGIDLFLVETVSSFIEVKSTLRKEHLYSIAKATKAIKSSAQLQPHRFNPSGLVSNPRPYSFVFAYDGPKNIQTVLNWMKEVSSADDYGLDSLRQTHPSDRSFFDHTFIDGVFLLKRGFVLVDAQPFQSFLRKHNSVDSVLDYIWIMHSEDELTMLWVLINSLNQLLLWNGFWFSEYLGKINLSYEKVTETSAWLGVPVYAQPMLLSRR